MCLLNIKLINDKKKQLFKENIIKCDDASCRDFWGYFKPFFIVFFIICIFLLKTIQVLHCKMLLSITLSFRSWGLVRMFDVFERSLVCSIWNCFIRNTVKTVIFWKCVMNVMAAELSADNTPVFHMIVQKVFRKWLIWCNKYYNYQCLKQYLWKQ